MSTQPARIVSLVPSWTETLFAFGLAERMVGVTRFCVHPAEALGSVEAVGGTKDPDIGRIIALKPDLVVCEHEENRKADVDALRDAGLNVWVSQVETLDDSIRETRALGQVAGRPEAGDALATSIAHTIAAITAARAAAPVPAYVPIWRSPWMTLTQETYAHHVLALAGVTNIFADHEGRYPERDPDEAIEAGARYALLPTEPYPFHTKPQAVDDLVAAGFPRDRVIIIDGESLTWYGAREPAGLRDIAAAVAKLG